MIEIQEYMCVDCEHFQKCLEDYNMTYEELHECSICGNFELYGLLKGDENE